MEDSNTTAATKFPHYCPSNACMNLFPENKPQNYKIQLDTPYKLEGSWQVALHSISYPNNWYNLHNTSVFCTVQVTKDAAVQSNVTTSYWAHIAKAQFPDVETLLVELNKQLNLAAKKRLTETRASEVGEETEKYFEFKLNNAYPQKIELFTSRKSSTVNLDNMYWELWGILGFEKNEDVDKEIKHGHKGKYQPSINLHFPSLYIYLPNLIKGVGVGERSTPLLATIPVKGEIKKFVHIEPINLVYIDLVQNYIRSIEIVIKDDKGDDIEFIAGKVNITLLFRRIG